ncbi:MAG: glycosyltransferase family 2 protein [Capnocytophaga sp.]|nr:glycosyltransferase family 2 protein [Capnocytophaga sp.]
MNFSIIIPAHNEADCIGLTLDSLLRQTKKPLQIIVVDDHSTDETPSVLRKYQSENECITVIRREEGATHLPGSKVVQTFNAGLSFLHPDTDIICKYDADLVFPENYLEVMESEFSKNLRLGMCGGHCLIEKNGAWVLENLTSKNHLRGALKAYRKECFEAVGGLKIAMGWDTADELLARYHGWEVKTIEGLGVKHLRPTGAGYNLNARYLQGSVFYRLRYGYILSLLASVKLALKKGNVRLSADYIKGFFKAKNEKQPFLVTKEQGKWIRKYRWQAIVNKIR